MKLTFRDSFGVTTINLDKFGVQFMHGYAYCSDDATSYMIPTDWILEITTEEVHHHNARQQTERETAHVPY